jgi:hypothetical protein
MTNQIAVFVTTTDILSGGYYQQPVKQVNPDEQLHLLC